MHSVAKMKSNTQTHSVGRPIHSSYSSVSENNIIKLLDDEFTKFENRVKNCENYVLLNVALPVRIIELFVKLFKMWVSVPQLSRTIDDFMFLTVYTELKNFFDDDISSDDDIGDAECCGDFYGLNPFAKFMETLHDSVPSIFNPTGTATTKKGKNGESLLGDEWITEKNGFIICNVCNTKFSDMVAVFKHMNSVDHLKNCIILKQNEKSAIFADEKSECFRCKLCKVEYSNLNSLVKHFVKPLHVRMRSNENTTIQPIEKKPSNCINTKTEVKSSTKVEYNQKFVLSKGSGKFCQLCKKDLPTIANVISHVKASDHLGKLSTFESNQNYAQLSTKGDQFHCVLCGISFSDLRALAEHFDSEDHKNSLKLKIPTTSESKSSKPKTKQNLDEQKLKKSAELCDSNKKSMPQINDSKSATKPTLKSVDKLSKVQLPDSDKKSVPQTDESKATVKPIPKPVDKLMTTMSANESKKARKAIDKSTNSIQLSDSDSKFVVQEGSIFTCMLCNADLNVIAEIIAHIKDKSHLQNVQDFNNHEQYIKLPTTEIRTFTCTKCPQQCDSFAVQLAHCKEHHINPPTAKAKPQDTFQLKESDSKFIKKNDKSFKCNLCEKELPTPAAIVSHTESSNHAKNCNVFAKNEQFAKLPCKNSAVYRCTVCQHEFNDLVSLVKHFKDDAHNKTAFEGKKPKVQDPVHIPAHGKAKTDPILTPMKTQKGPKQNKTPKKERKNHENGAIKKSTVKTPTSSKTNDAAESKIATLSETVTALDNVAMKKPDNYVIAKNDIFYCRLCNSDLPEMSVAAHMNGATHRINIEVFETCESYVRDTNDAMIECTLCKVTFDNVHETVKHFKQKRHPKPGVSAMNSSIDGGLFGCTDFTKTTENVINEKPNTPAKRVQISECDRKHIFRLNGVIRCNLCGANLVDFDALETHLADLDHRRNSNIFIENESYIKQLDSIRSSFECTLCSFSSTLHQVIKHCKKKQHLKAKNTDDGDAAHDVTPVRRDIVAKITEADRKCVVMKNGIVRCNLCHSKLPRESTLISHMSGKTHIQYCEVYKYNELYIEQFDGGYSYRCILCNVIFSRLDTAIKHCLDISHVLLREKEFTRVEAASNCNDAVNIASCDFECNLCAITFTGFANLAKHCCSKQHKILKSAIQPVQKGIPYHVAITDYQYHCYACGIRLHNKAAMRKHQSSPTHVKMETYYKGTRSESSASIELVSYVYSCSLCWLPMYSESELIEHEKSEMHKMGKNFDMVWKCNENHLNLNNRSGKVRCKLCDATFGIEKLVQHCTSREHRKKFIADQMGNYVEDEHIVWKNSTQYCILCNCKLINDHNLINHVNSEGHKLKMKNVCVKN